MLIDEEKRKDVNERAKMINSSDITFLCLPDAAAIEAASLCTNPDVNNLYAHANANFCRGEQCSPVWLTAL